jgi:hypothetical protein
MLRHASDALPEILENREVAWRHPLSGCLYYIALLMRKSIIIAAEKEAVKK